MDGRSWQSDTSTYKYTGKERDNESTYDYFGARYYDSRIGRWGSVDTLFSKHYDFSPYNYVLNNPLHFIDKNGRQETPEEFAKEVNKYSRDQYLGIKKFCEVVGEVYLDALIDVAIETGGGHAGLIWYSAYILATHLQGDNQNLYNQPQGDDNTTNQDNGSKNGNKENNNVDKNVNLREDTYYYKYGFTPVP